jgi:hypothetical protein
MWDVASGYPQPVLVLSRGRGLVKALGVLPDLGLLATAHNNAKVSARAIMCVLGHAC